MGDDIGLVFAYYPTQTALILNPGCERLQPTVFFIIAQLTIDFRLLLYLSQAGLLPSLATTLERNIRSNSDAAVISCRCRPSHALTAVVAAAEITAGLGQNYETLRDTTRFVFEQWI